MKQELYEKWQEGDISYIHPGRLKSAGKLINVKLVLYL